MTISVRLDPETERLIALLVKRYGRSKSEIIRRALVLLAQQEETDDSADSGPYQSLSHLIGCVRDGPRDLSVNTGRQLRKILEEKRQRSHGSG